jgi:hypothetical protein
MKSLAESQKGERLSASVMYLEEVNNPKKFCLDVEN